jgi:DNA-damage-inducible protein D
VVDVVVALTDSTNPKDCRKKIRKKDEKLGEYVGTNCPDVTMQSASMNPTI